jgi:hypothetical protein
MANRKFGYLQRTSVNNVLSGDYYDAATYATPADNDHVISGAISEFSMRFAKFGLTNGNGVLVLSDASNTYTFEDLHLHGHYDWWFHRFAETAGKGRYLICFNGAVNLSNFSKFACWK